MPQLDFTWYASQIFWLFVTFGLLYIGMSKKALPRLSEILQGRRERIADDLEAAEGSRQRAEALEAELVQQRKQAAARAQELIAQTQGEADQVAAERHAELDKTLARKLKEADAAISQARADASARIVPVAVELTAATLARVANLNLPQDKIEQLITKLSKENLYV